MSNTNNVQKRKQYDQAFKRKLIADFEDLQRRQGKVNKTVFATNHGMTSSTLGSILKMKDSTMKAEEDGSIGTSKRLRTSSSFQSVNWSFGLNR